MTCLLRLGSRLGVRTRLYITRPTLNYERKRPCWALQTRSFAKKSKSNKNKKKAKTAENLLPEVIRAQLHPEYVKQIEEELRQGQEEEARQAKLPPAKELPLDVFISHGPPGVAASGAWKAASRDGDKSLNAVEKDIRMFHDMINHVATKKELTQYWKSLPAEEMASIKDSIDNPPADGGEGFSDYKKSAEQVLAGTYVPPDGEVQIFRTYIEDQMVSAEDKLERLKKDHGGKIHEITMGLIEELCAGKHIHQFEKALDAYLLLMSKYRNEVSVVIKSAEPLSDANLNDLKKAITAKTDGIPIFSTVVDRSLVAGFTVTIGEVAADFSMSSRMQNIEATISSAVRSGDWNYKTIGESS